MFRRITGVMVQYYISCKRELWFFSNQINMNYDNEDIEIGNLIHKKYYDREKKEVRLGEVSFDFIKTGSQTSIFEIKKSSKLEEPVRWQLYYYMYYIGNSSNEVKGIILYPEERKREVLESNDEIKSKIECIIEDIKKIIVKDKPPQIIKKPYCKRCSYYELCYI